MSGQRKENDKGYVSIAYSLYVAGSFFKGYHTLARKVYGLAYFHILKYSYTNCSCKISVHVLPTNNDQILNWRIHKNRCLYWATAIMAFLFNTLYAALSIWNLVVHNKPAIISCLIDHNCSVLSDAKVYKDEVFTVLAVIIII